MKVEKSTPTITSKPSAIPIKEISKSKSEDPQNNF
jgi:hypothetical protein